MSKIVLVETISLFRHLYAIELEDDEPAAFAEDSVVFAATGGDTKLEDFAQKHISEDILSHRVISEEQYLELFDNENNYLSEWSAEQKKKFIYKEGQ